MSKETIRVPFLFRRFGRKVNLSVGLSILAVIIAARAFLLSVSAYHIEYGSAEGRVDKHRIVATAFSEFVQENCIDDRNSLCEMYVRNAEEYLNTYAAVVERESSRLTDQQYDGHLWEMQRVRITLAVAEL